MTQEGPFAFGTDEMLDVPVLAESSYNPLFNRSTTCTANWDSHAIVATQTIQLIHIVGGKASSAFDFTSSRIQLDTATRAIEVITVINFTTES